MIYYNPAPRKGQAPRCQRVTNRAGTGKKEGARKRLISGRFSGASGQTRTGDLLITNQLLYRLSYTSTAFRARVL